MSGRPVKKVAISSRNHAYPKESQILGFVAHDSNILVHVGKEYLKVEQEKGGRDAEHQECLKDNVPLCDYDAKLRVQFFFGQVGIVQYEKELDRVPSENISHTYRHYINQAKI